MRRLARRVTGDDVGQLRQELHALAADVERLTQEVGRWQQLSAPGPERSLILGAVDGRAGRRVLCSLAVGPYVDLLAVSSITFEAYAALHGFDLRFSTELLAPERPPAWSKIALVRDLLERYDEVLWVDADAIFVDISKDIADLLRPDKDLYLVEHLYEEDDSWRSANTGVFLVRSSDWSRRFFERVWAAEQYIDHPWWENAAVLDLLGYELSPDLSPPRKLRSTEFDSHVELIGLEWNSTAGAPLPARVRIRHHGRSNDMSELRDRLLEDLITFRRNLASRGARDATPAAPAEPR
jgi:galactosyl transferase GMA12/MNN10 family